MVCSCWGGCISGSPMSCLVCGVLDSWRASVTAFSVEGFFAGPAPLSSSSAVLPRLSDSEAESSMTVSLLELDELVGVAVYVDIEMGLSRRRLDDICFDWGGFSSFCWFLYVLISPSAAYIFHSASSHLGHPFYVARSSSFVVSSE